MGNWKSIIVFICYMSIVTVIIFLSQNILLFAFSSQQIVSIFPQIFESGKNLVFGNTDIATLVGGAATGVLSAMINIGESTLETVTESISNLGLENITETLANATSIGGEDGMSIFESTN